MPNISPVSRCLLNPKRDKEKTKNTFYSRFFPLVFTTVGSEFALL
jgi:hypothetical protein